MAELNDILDGVGNIPVFPISEIITDGELSIRSATIDYDAYMQNISFWHAFTGNKNITKISTGEVFNLDYIYWNVDFLNRSEYPLLRAWLETTGVWENENAYVYALGTEKIDLNIPFSNYNWNIRANENLNLSENFRFVTKNGVNAFTGTESYTVDLRNCERRVLIARVGEYIGYIFYARRFDTSERQLFLYSYLFKEAQLKTILGTFEVEEKAIFSEIFGEPSDIGGFGGVGSAFSVVSDAITLPSKPSLGVSTTGLYNVYKVNEFTLSNFGSFLFQTDVSGDEYYIPTTEMSEKTDVTNEVAKVFNSIGSRLERGFKQTVNGDLVQYVVDCHIIPFNPNVNNNPVYIKCGWKTSEYLGKKVSDDYKDISLGTIQVPSMYNNFLDMSANVRLFLPFLGYVSLNTQEVLGKNINVTYRFNVIDGSFIAYVRTMLDNNYTIIGAYSGSSCVHMPLTGVNYSNVVSGMMQTIGGVTQTLGGNPLGVMNLAQGVTAMNSSGNVQQSNGYNASASFMGCREAFIVIEYPQQQLPSNYYHTYGSPLYAEKVLGNLRGYTKCNNVDLTTSGIDKDDMDEIKTLLESGVYL